jgi:hypothetical protein
VRGRGGDPGWVRPSVFGLLAATGVLYLWNLAGSGWANAFYSAAVQGGPRSWTAACYGSSDAAGSITVDKPGEQREDYQVIPRCARDASSSRR